MNRREGFLRQALWALAGLAVLTSGIALSKTSNLGTSAISGIPCVLSFVTPLSMGTASMIVNGLLVLIQVALLRRATGLAQLLQLPFVILMGVLIDVWNTAFSWVGADTYLVQALLCLASIFLTAVGVSLIVHSGLTSAPAEGLALVLSGRTGIPFSRTKTAVDCCLAGGAVLLSLVFLGRLEGVREGTVVAVLCVGFLSRQVSRFLFERRQAPETVPAKG